ncbi:fibronectin type III domain-containing protein, partial [Nocardioides sp.]|uniref:fibronectin type III domain-containing protein n=1 Tax=Nocardioides sp. TaxID=35761 RepID=UPI0025F00CDA
TDPFLRGVVAVDAKGPFVYVNENGWDIHRVDRRTDRIVTICCRYWSGWDPPEPVEGDLATQTHFEIHAGPVADRSGNVFFAHQGSAALEIWEIRAGDGTIHQVAGGGSEPAGDRVAPLDLELREVGDLDLDPDGNLYLTTGAKILKLPGVAAADAAPGAPGDLDVTPGVGRLDVSWAQPTDDGGQPVTSYTVRVHPVGLSGDSRDHVTTVTTRTATITGLDQGASYEVSVAATNGRGTGPAATTTATASAYGARLTASPAAVHAGDPVRLDASGSEVPAGSTFEF